MKLLKFFLFALATGSLLFLAGCSKSRSSAAQKPAEMMTKETFERLSTGRNLYHVRGCAACHGGFGRGDGDRSSQLLIPPRDFRQLAFYRQGSSLESVAATILTGVTNGPTNPRTNSFLKWMGRKPSLPMPAYPFLTLEEREAIAAYVLYLRELPGP